MRVFSNHIVVKHSLVIQKGTRTASAKTLSPPPSLVLKANSAGTIVSSHRALKGCNRYFRESWRSASTQNSRMSNLCGDTFFLDEFAFRQFDGGQAAQLPISKQEFIQTVHELYKKGGKLIDGYAPFCKHVFVPNFTSATAHAIEITKENEAQLKTGYSRRRPTELDVLTRWFPKGKVEAHKAKYLDLILYSREQIAKEYDDMPEKGSKPSNSLPDAPWGIISIKPQDEDYETPMQPITVMRNSLGREQGGSGVPLDHDAYKASVKYWKDRAPVIAGSPSGE